MTWDLDAIRRSFVNAPEEAVFLERAQLLVRAQATGAHLPPGRRQGQTIALLCEGVTPVVEPEHVLLSRVREVVPTAADEALVQAHPELFTEPGVPGFLDSASLYIPDWDKLLRLGLDGLRGEVETCRQPAGDRNRRDWLDGVELSLRGVSRLLERYAAEARRIAATARSADRDNLLAAAACCDHVAHEAPRTLREALQLFAVYHLALACLAGGRNVTPGRMDQYLRPFYDRDLASGELSREQESELLAIAMIGLPQLSGPIATDFQSRKRTPNRYAHAYVTLGGVDRDGRSAVSELSLAFVEAIRLVGYREPSLSIRYFDGLDGEFWRAAVAAMRDGLPVFAYHDGAVIAGLQAAGVPLAQARGYAHCACLNCFLPGEGLPCRRDSHNGAEFLLRALRRQASSSSPGSFDDLFEAFRAEARTALEQAAHRHAGARSSYPLLAWPLFDGHLELLQDFGDSRVKFADQHLVGLANVVDSLLVVQRVIEGQGQRGLAELAAAVATDFAGYETRLRAAATGPRYGCDDPQVRSLAGRVGRMWVDEVRRASLAVPGVVLRPGFHSWLYHLELGARTGATPDGRRAGEPLSADHAPSPGCATGTLEALLCMASLPHDQTCSGGCAVRLVPAQFAGDDGAERLATLVEGYFALGGLHLQFVLADAATLREAMADPEPHADLLVRVTGFSEYFTRLLPAVQEAVVERAEGQ